MTKRIAATVCLLFAALACGGTGSGAPPSGSDAAPGGPAADDACGQTAHASCTRLQTCSPALVQIRYGDEATCEARQKTSCVNALGASGQGNTPSRVEACAAAYGGWTCTDFLDDVNVPAPCATAKGSLAAGSACAFSGQCATSYCAIAPGSACGTCAALPSAGDSCAALTSCGAGLSCTTDTHACVAFAAGGAACGKGAPCGAGLSCVGADASPSAMGTCQAAVEASGGTCDPAEKTAPACDRNAGLVCNGTSKECTTLAFAAGGEGCNDVASQYTPCAAGGLCSTDAAGTMGTCTAAAADGAECDTAIGPPCLDPARCIVSPDGGTAGTCELENAASCP